MKKRTVIVSVILLLVLLVAYLIPYYDQKEVLILAGIIKPAQELNSPAEWQKWNPALKKYCAEKPDACVITADQALNNFTIKTPQGSISVTSRTASFDVTEINGNKTSSFNYTLVPSLHDDSTRLIITTKGSLLLALLPNLFDTAVAYGGAYSLKTFIETPSGFYGFPFEISPTIDTCVVTIQKRITITNRATTLKDLYGKLNNFITANHLVITRPYITHIQQAGKDSVDITAGIPVNKTLPRTSTKNNISFMNMPLQGRMVVGYYKGRFADRIKLYEAEDRFIVDKKLKKVAATYEEYPNDKVPENDSALVEIKICSPVY